jgi:uncharacterized MAPEG superfamily protein
LNIEIRILAWTVMLGFVHVVAASHAANLQRGYLWTASARDREVAPLTGIAGRLDRALRNFSKTFPLFAALLLAAQAIGRHCWLTEAGAILYFVARLAYLPLYVFGAPIVRSRVWNVAALGMALLLVAIFWG